jgi:hypothetical protein
MLLPALFSLSLLIAPVHLLQSCVSLHVFLLLVFDYIRFRRFERIYRVRRDVVRTLCCQV